MGVEHIGSGTVAVKSDTRRLLLVKRLNKIGGVALTSDTRRLLLAKIDKAIKLLGTSSSGI